MTISAGTLPSFSSSVSSARRDHDIGQLLAGYTTANRVAFVLRLRNVTLAAGTSLTDSFFNLNSQTGHLTVFHPLEADGSEFNMDILATDSGIHTEAVVFSWVYTVVVDTDDVLNRTEVPFALELDGSVLLERDLPQVIAVGTALRFNGPAANAARTLSETNALLFVEAQGQVSYRIDPVAGD